MYSEVHSCACFEAVIGKQSDSEQVVIDRTSLDFKCFSDGFAWFNPVGRIVADRCAIDKDFGPVWVACSIEEETEPFTFSRHSYIHFAFVFECNSESGSFVGRDVGYLVGFCRQFGFQHPFGAVVENSAFVVEARAFFCFVWAERRTRLCGKDIGAVLGIVHIGYSRRLTYTFSSSQPCRVPLGMIDTDGDVTFRVSRQSEA